MCGIAIVVNGNRTDAHRMGSAMNHRGKFSDVTCIDNVHVYFSYLPITDQRAPIQPYSFGKYTLWMNGFISNYKELIELYAINVSSNCDTEFLVKFIDRFGYSKLNELNGFFSVACYDGKELYCFTDRYGIKQLYKYFDSDNGKTYIASEVKSILAACPGIALDETAIEDWKYSLGVMTDNTIYSGIERVPCLPFVHPKMQLISYEDAKDRLRFLLGQSIKRNKVTGVKDCVFLSGGVDSGILAKYLNPDFCFSMDYADEKFSEAENIKLNSTGIHYSMICNRSLFEKYKHEAMKAIDDLKAGSCYTNFALTELASKFCTVIYSGAGGDELFDGYTHRYNRPVNEVIKRTEREGEWYAISHKQYDWKYLKGILVVEDRMSGYHTMETRYPFLDNDLVDFVLSLHPEYLVNKRILKDVSGLDEKVITGKKKGFSNPYFTNQQWIDHALNSKLCNQQQQTSTK